MQWAYIFFNTRYPKIIPEQIPIYFEKNFSENHLIKHFHKASISNYCEFAIQLTCWYNSCHFKS